MDEKKLTDEEIVKALECCAVEPCEDCGNCPRFTKEKLCHKANAKQSLDLINRQKAKIERLTEEKAKYKGLYETMYRKWSDLSDKEFNCEALRNEKNEYLDKAVELQRQVDLLKDGLVKTTEAIDTALYVTDNCKKKVEQAVKDTARECLDDIVDCIESMLDGERYMTKNEVEYLLEHILNKKQEYGVEVDE